MRKAFLVAASAAFLLAGPVTATALADCKSEIANVRGMLSGLHPGHKGHEIVEAMLEKAEMALADGKKKKCDNIAKKAKDKASAY